MSAEQQSSPRIALPGGRPRLERLDWWIMLGLFVVCLATRVPFWPDLITNPDGAEYACALDDFNVAAGNPHPPGYILFVACAKAFYAFGTSAEGSLLITSVLFSALACAMLYALGTAMFGRQVGLAAGILLLFENNFWRLGLGHISSVTAAFWGIAVALACYRAGQRPGLRWTLISAAVLGLAVGFRQELLVFLGPLWLWCCRRSGGKSLLGGLAVIAVLTGLWMAATGLATGDFAAYRAASRAQWQEVIYGTSVFAAGGQGVSRAVHVLVEHLGTWFDLVFGGHSHLSVLGWLLLAIYACGRLLRLDLLAQDIRSQILAFWVLPAFCFHLTFHMFARAHATVYGPPLILLAGVGAYLVASDWSRARRSPPGELAVPLGPLVVILGIATLVNVGAFGLATLPGEQRTEANLRARLEYIGGFSPQEIVLVQSDTFQDYPAVKYYLPEYTGYLLRQTYAPLRAGASVTSPIRLPDGVKYAIFLNPQARVAGETRTVELAAGAWLKLYALAPAERWMHFGPAGVRFAAHP